MNLNKTDIAKIEIVENIVHELFDKQIHDVDTSWKVGLFHGMLVRDVDSVKRLLRERIELEIVELNAGFRLQNLNIPSDL